MRTRIAAQWATAAMGLVLIVGVWQVATVRAEAARQSASPTAVAVIDIGKVLEQLEEKRTRLADLEEYGRTLEARVEQVQSEMEGIVADLEVLPKDTSQFISKQDAAIRKEMEFQGEREFAQFRFNERKQRTKLELFNKIVAAASSYAEREGFDIVLNDDRDLVVPEAQVGQMTDQAFQAFVMSRRVISASATVDITDEVAQQMNNLYKVAQ